MGSYEDAIKGIVVMSVGITILTIHVVVLGKVFDAMMYTLGGIGIELSPQFADILQHPLEIYSLFYYLPLIFSILLIVWGFKIIVFRHSYTYEEGMHE